MTKRVTIKDVAAEAGVTAQAVSRALGDADDISEATKTRVREIAKRLGYVKNGAASALRSGNPKTVAIVYDNPLNLYFSFMTAYLRAALEERGYSMLVAIEPARRFTPALYRSLLSRNVSGVLSFLEPTAEMERAIEDYGVPVVLVGRRSAVENVACIYTDDVTGGRLAAAYFATRGLKRIAYLTEDFDLTCARDRYEGFLSELTERGNSDGVALLPLAGKTASERLAEAFATGARYDGIACFSDFLAYEATCFLKARGVSIPVVGYDDVAEKIFIPTPVPSVGSDKRAIAEASVDAIIRKIAGEKVENGVFPVRFKEGNE